MSRLTPILKTLAASLTLFALALPARAVSLPPVVHECARSRTEIPSLNCALLTLGNIARIILGLTGSIALLMFVYGGFLLLASGGRADWVERGKSSIKTAVIGIAIIFLSGTIVQYAMTKLNVNVQTPTSQPSGQ